ncbi:winged helix-turn-helix domain-containing tetratricopeptide repeat protein [Alteromonas facilis]|uniref:winged helix-turn-helix domain-containing tetratricopeptide repeat protein n=1 Tax=Alteromonas facilis TaxID=2048004 RepID=UPI000C281E0D|nr:winged helix-turn-helix domain-containing protein [Alteromonas facilis]
MSLQNSQKYRLGRWVVCPITNTFQDTDEQRSIDNKSMQVLLFLIQNSGQNVTKEQIIEHVWKDSVVSEEILSVAISKIRKALGDNARQPTFIKTVPNVGYCLIANVKPLAEYTQPEDAPSNMLNLRASNSKPYFIGITFFLLAIIFIVSFYRVYQEPENKSLADISSIAVLPFEDLNENKDNIYFTEGLSVAIINQLSQSKSLKVISSDSSFNFRGNKDPSVIGNALKVEALLDGSVQQLAEQVRVNVRVISSFDGRLLWAKSFDGQHSTVFNLQDQISREIKQAIQPTSQSEISDNKKIDSQAYEWFLMAQYHWRQRTPISLSKAETYFKHSLELEPSYVDAYVGLAITYGQFHYNSNWSAKEAVDKGLPYAEQALILEPNSSMALAAKGMLLTLKAAYSKAPLPILNEAQDLFVRSLALEDSATTHHWYSLLLNQLGEEALVIKHIEHAIALNPLSASLKRIYSEYLAIRGKLDTAQKLYSRAQILEPDRDSSIVESTHVFRNSPSSIVAIAEWQLTNSELFEYCVSDEYCEQVVFSYLSIGLEKEANKILARMTSKHEHFEDSLKLIDYGLKGELINTVSLLKQLSETRPNNYKYNYSLAIAQFRADLFEQTKTSLLYLYPDWRNDGEVEVTTDNYLALILYGATLLKLDEQDYANAVLNNVGQFLLLDKVHDKAQAEMALAQVNAQLNQSSKATKHLRKALNHGWLETFDREWWALQDDHLLEPIKYQAEFETLVQDHQEKVKEIAKRISLKLEDLGR